MENTINNHELQRIRWFLIIWNVAYYIPFLTREEKLGELIPGFGLPDWSFIGEIFFNMFMLLLVFSPCLTLLFVLILKKPIGRIFALFSGLFGPIQIFCSIPSIPSILVELIAVIFVILIFTFGKVLYTLATVYLVAMKEEKEKMKNEE